MGCTRGMVFWSGKWFEKLPGTFITMAGRWIAAVCERIIAWLNQKICLTFFYKIPGKFFGTRVDQKISIAITRVV
jgi:hypothetical protein